MSTRSFAIAAPIFLAIYILQEGLINQVRLPGGGFSIFIIFAITWATLSTPEIGALAGFGAGLLMDMSQSSSGPVGHWTLVMILTGFTVAFLGYGDDNVRANPFSIVVLVATGIAGAQLAYIFSGLLLGIEVGSIRSVAFTIIGNGFWNVLVTPILLPAISWLHSFIYGTKSRI